MTEPEARYGWPTHEVDCPKCSREQLEVCYHTPNQRKNWRKQRNARQARRDALANGDVWV